MVELAPFRASDSATLLDWIPDDEFLAQWAGPMFSPPLDLAQLEAFREQAERESQARRLYRLTRTGSREMLGYGELGAIDPQCSSARLSRLLVEPGRRGEGLGLALVDALLSVAFDELALHRVELGVYDFNRGAIRCYEKAGFRIEGTRRECHLVAGSWWNSCTMGILAPEWRARHSR
jgi:RimJ/RimL family protein N-acetyltransferase